MLMIVTLMVTVIVLGDVPVGGGGVGDGSGCDDDNATGDSGVGHDVTAIFRSLRTQRHRTETQFDVFAPVNQHSDNHPNEN